MANRLTEAQKVALRDLNDDKHIIGANESVVKALVRKGMAERYVNTIAYMTSRHAYRITPAGRAALEKRDE